MFVLTVITIFIYCVRLSICRFATTDVVDVKGFQTIVAKFSFFTQKKEELVYIIFS